MRIFSLLFGRKSVSNGETDLLDARARLHRLEIAHGELKDYVSQLAGHHLKLRKQFDGSKGGRPRETLSLDEVPHGDKAGLRRALGVVPGARFNHQE